MKITRIFSLILALALQVMPLLRTFIPMQFQTYASSAWAVVFRLGAGATALLGSFHAVSGATQIATPYTVNATNGVAYKRRLTTTVQSALSWTAATGPLNATVYPLTPGLYLTNRTGYIGGVPTAAGTSNIVITAWENNDNTGASVSSTFVFTIISLGTPPTITGPPASQTAAVGGNAAFAVTASGTAPLTYQWRFAGTNLASGTASNLALGNLQPTDAGTYTIFITNAYGAASNTATLTVLKPALITNQPLSQATVAGKNLSFSVGASGDNLAYQWFFKGSPLANATQAIYNVTAAATNQSGAYFALVTNLVSSTASSNALLVVAPLPTTNNAPQLASPPPPAQNGKFALNLTTQPGYSYQVQYKDQLASLNWLVLTNIPPALTNQAISIAEQLAGSNRFFRVIIPSN